MPANGGLNMYDRKLTELKVEIDDLTPIVGDFRNSFWVTEITTKR